MWCDGLQIVQLERELFGDERRKPLRTLAEDHLLRRLHCHAQVLVLDVKREHPLGQSRRIGRKRAALRLDPNRTKPGA